MIPQNTNKARRIRAGVKHIRNYTLMDELIDFIRRGCK
jgi:hypothetical protein